MVSIQKIFKLLSVLVFMTSCNNDYEDISKNDDTKSKKVFNLKSNLTTNGNTEDYSPNSLVVMFKKSATTATKAMIRDHYDVKSFEVCKNCSDQSIELWEFEPDIQIEPKKETIDNPNGGFKLIVINNIASVDLNYNIRTNSKNLTSSNKVNSISMSNNKMILPTLSYQSYIKTTNNGINIGVFDTGINPFLNENSLPVFPSPFLYNANGDGYSNIYTGWDFVNSDNDPIDDDPNFHGTAVTSIISKKLASLSIPHQIMPLKIADRDGHITYFNLVCSLNYALQRKVKVLNMSLGWYTNSSDMNSTAFENLLIENPKAILVCSAGNRTNNNDIDKHWPSSFTRDQIIAVGSCNSSNQISTWSNYGKVSVDFLAKGEEITFLGNPIQGTSFAAPIVTARVAEKIYNSNTGNPSNPTNIEPLQLIENIKSGGLDFSTQNLIKHDRILF